MPLAALRTRAALAFAALLLLSGVASCPDRAQDPERRIALVFTSDLLGYLEPCGCVKGQLGGLPRAVAQVEAWRDSHDGLLWIDAGDTVAERAAVDARLEAQVRAKAEAVAGILSRTGVVSVPGELDLGAVAPVWGEAFAKSALTREAGKAGARLLRVGGVPVALLGFSSPDAPPEAIAKALAAARATVGEARVTLAVLHVGLEAAQRAAPLLVDVVDAILVGHLHGPAEGDADRALVDAAVPIFRTMSQGRSLGLLELRVPRGAPAGLSLIRGEAARSRETGLLEARIKRLRAQADAARAEGELSGAEALQAKVHELEARRAIARDGETRWPTGRAAYTWRFLPLAGSLPEAGWAREVVARYDAQVAEANLAWARAHGAPCPAPGEGEAHYVGDAACAGCHAEATAFWKTTRHAGAWATLEAEGKTLDLECVGCHVTGWQRPGGLCQLDRIGKLDEAAGHQGSLENVQCESCHGPGSAHVAAGSAGSIRRAAPAAVCRTCHVGEHSPHFGYDAFRAKIVGPGHGSP